jgi:transcription elongation factor Elf1
MASKNGRHKKRQHVYRRPKDRPGAAFTGSHHCPECGKWCYSTRDAAEAAVRKAHPGATVHYYECGQWWHYTSMTAAQVSEIRARAAVTEEEEDPGYAPEETVA